jgi:hypothetical protein
MTVPAGTAAIRSFTRPGLTLVIALSGLAGMSVCAVPARSSADSTLTVLGVPRQDAVIGNILAAPIRLRVRRTPAPNARSTRSLAGPRQASRGLVGTASLL